jgi:hypothetical protein
VTRTFLIAGLLLLATFLPLAALPAAIFVVSVLFVVVALTLAIRADAPPLPLLARVASRAPPSR